MRIIDQKRNHSIDVSSVLLWTQYGEIYADFAGRSFPIGNYSTQERADEVFAEIHKAYASVKQTDNFVFMMPEE